MPKTLILRLPTPMIPAERDTVTSDLSSTLVKIDAIKAEKKEATSGFNAELKQLDARQHSLNASLISGTVEREVEVEEKTDLFRGVVITIRKDTGDAVKERPLEPEERQMNLGEPLVPGTVTDIDEERKRRTEEQNVAGSPEEAEEMRNRRLADEAAERAKRPPDLPEVGNLVEIRQSVNDDWQEAQVTVRTELSFQAAIDIGADEAAPTFDLSQHGISWRWPPEEPSWEDVQAESAELQRIAEVDRLAAEQARDDGPKHLLKKPTKPPADEEKEDKKSGKKKSSPKHRRVSVNDQKELCPPVCNTRHKHTEERAPF